MAVTNISERKRAEELLLRNQALFSTLIEQAPLGVYVVDERLRMQQVNPMARPAFSKIHPLEGRDFSEIMRIIWPEKIAAEIMEQFRRTLKSGKDYQSAEFSERRRDSGVTESYDWQLQRLTLPTGQYGVVCFFNNITERKHAEAMRRRVEVLAASNKKLELEIVRRQAVEITLGQSQREQTKLLAQARHLQEQLRHLSRQILLAQEEDRKAISRELHDQIAQTLVGINVHLAGLGREAPADPQALQQKIARTQKLVEQSVDIVHRFARDLRPAMLDELGLVPALQSYLKEFMERTKLRVRFEAFPGVEKLNGIQRTVLYRVAQSALANIAQHARATQITVSLKHAPDAVRMEVHDDGRSFEVGRVLLAKKYKRLGILGMRERVEMVGGVFVVESAPGQGTTIRAEIPFASDGERRKAQPLVAPAYAAPL